MFVIHLHIPQFLWVFITVHLYICIIGSSSGVLIGNVRVLLSIFYLSFFFFITNAQYISKYIYYIVLLYITHIIGTHLAFRYEKLESTKQTKLYYYG